LITPKLLIDLKYDPLLTVLCVFNGPWVKWDHGTPLQGTQKSAGGRKRRRNVAEDDEEEED
jgi:hypothetical protein